MCYYYVFVFVIISLFLWGTSRNSTVCVSYCICATVTKAQNVCQLKLHLMCWWHTWERLHQLWMRYSVCCPVWSSECMVKRVMRLTATSRSNPVKCQRIYSGTRSIRCGGYIQSVSSWGTTHFLNLDKEIDAFSLIFMNKLNWSNKYLWIVIVSHYAFLCRCVKFLGTN